MARNTLNSIEAMMARPDGVLARSAAEVAAASGGVLKLISGGVAYYTPIYNSTTSGISGAVAETKTPGELVEAVDLTPKYQIGGRHGRKV